MTISCDSSRSYLKGRSRNTDIFSWIAAGLADALPGAIDTETAALNRKRAAEARRHVQWSRQDQRKDNRQHFDILGPDMLIIASTINNAVCSHNLMIPTLAKFLVSSSEDADLEEVAKLMNREVREVTGGSQIPEMRSTLNYKLCLKEIFNDNLEYKSELNRMVSKILDDKRDLIGLVEDGARDTKTAEVVSGVFKFVKTVATKEAIDKVIGGIKGLLEK